MRGFFYKDVVMSKISLIVIAALTVISAGVGVSVTKYYEDDLSTAMIFSLAVVVMDFIFVGMFDTGLFSFDENRLWQSFAASAPQAFKAQAQSKYLLVLAINLFVIFVFFIADNVAAFLTDTAYGMMTSTAFLMFSIQLISCAVEIPFMVRFGSQKGVNVKFAVVGSIILIAGIYLLFGDISFLSEENFEDSLTAFLQKGGTVWVMALLPYFAIALYFLSYKISAALYRKGAENYD